ncbi:MAG: DUF1992 domain-containing protein [Deltaproteobacteria bacterium]|jgi:hypothetical protein|nr:DUF1992 domain-containing protein [Deltaproteobacteria bacterium]
MADDRIDILALVAERKIREAIDKGLLDGLPGAGKPLPDDDLAGLPDDLRLAWRIMRSAGYNDQSPGTGKASVGDLFAQAPEEGLAAKRLSRLRLRLARRNRQGPAQIDDGPEGSDILQSPYLERLLKNTT